MGIHPKTQATTSRRSISFEKTLVISIPHSISCTVIEKHTISIIYIPCQNIQIITVPITMFSKIKNMFAPTQQPSSANNQAPFHHPKMGDGDASECPFMKNKKEQSSNADKCPVAGKGSDGKQVHSDSEEEEKPRGGCPFMGGSDRKKNPSLGLSVAGYDEPFVSKFKYYLSANKLDFSAMKGGRSVAVSRDVFDRYPIYLQHTLFYNGEDYKKVRGLECCSRFMAYEELREKGNKHYNKGKYYQALDYYERALSLFRWLEYSEQLNESRVSSEAPHSEQSIDELSQTGSKIEIPLGEKTEEDPADAFSQLREKYKEFFITYNDDNVRECNGEELTEAPDIDMRKSLLVQLYLNMAAAYINLHHYRLAEQVIDDGLALSDRVSQLFFRKAQTIGLCKNSSLQRLYLARSLIERAVQMRPTEKIFSTANTNILKMLNLHDSQAAYAACLAQVNEAIAVTEARQAELTKRVYLRAKEIHLIEQRMIEEGKTPRESLNDRSLGNCSEMRILERMLKKYERVVEFYTEAKNPEQIELAKKEFQECLRVAQEANQLFSVKITEENNELGGLETVKIQKRVNIIKTRFAEDIYNSGKFNFTMLEWAIKEIVKEEAEEEKLRKEEQAKLNPPVNEPAAGGLMTGKNLGNLMYLVLLIPLAVIAMNYFVL